MPKFYFTYDLSPGRPFRGGWTEVTAPNQPAACTVFKMFHPETNAGRLNCADILDEDRFLESNLWLTGHLGGWCREEIVLDRKLVGKG